MTRRAVGFDRLMTLVAGLALIALGVFAMAWQRGLVGGGRPLKLLITDTMANGWWPWASGAVGVVAVLAGVRWLLTHRPAPRARRVGLTGADRALTADATAVARAGAAVLGGQPGVLKAGGSATFEHGTPVVTLTVTVPAQRGLRPAIQAADDAARGVAEMLGDAVAVRSIVRVGTKSTPTPVR